MTDRLINQGYLDAKTDTRREKEVKRYREKIRHLYAKEHLRLPVAGREAWKQPA